MDFDLDLDMLGTGMSAEEEAEGRCEEEAVAF